jgi:hypothetical protein
MSITYPLDFPDIPGVTAFGMTPRANVAAVPSEFTFEDEIQEWDGQQWVIEIRVEPLLDPTHVRLMKAFLAKLNGKKGTFLFGDPSAPEPAGVATGTPVADTIVSPPTNRIRDRKLYTTGWTPGETGILLEGDYFQLGTGAAARLHMNLTDADSDGSGNATLDIWPKLQSDIADGVPLVVTNPRGVFRMSTNQPRWNVSQSIQHGFTIPAYSVVG